MANRMSFASALAGVLISVICATSAPAHAQVTIHTTDLRSGCTLGTATDTWGTAATTTLTITGWTGGCRDGLRDGVGTLSETETRTMAYGSTTTRTRVSEGAFVRGTQRGLWCFIEDQQTAKDSWTNLDGVREDTVSQTKNPLGCALHDPTYSDTLYVKQADGRWLSLDAPKDTPVFIPAGLLERESDRILAEARANKTITPANLTVETSLLDDLVRGSRIQLRKVEGPLDLKKKRVAIVMSSKAISEFERLGRETQAFLDLTAGSAPKKPADRAAWEQERGRLKAEATSEKTLRGVTNWAVTNTASVAAADDLSVLQAKTVDYVILVDWRYSGNFVLTDKQYLSLPLCDVFDQNAACDFFRSTLSFYLIDQNLNAVKENYSSLGSARRRKNDELKGKAAIQDAMRRDLLYAFRNSDENGYVLNGLH